MAKLSFQPTGSVSYWVPYLSQVRLEATENRWASRLTRYQLNNPWQRILIDGQILPGFWHFEKMKRKLVVQQNKKSGGDNGSNTIRGLVNPQFTLHGEIYTPSQLTAWIAVTHALEVIANDPKNRQSQHTFEAQMAKLCGINAVIVMELEYSPPSAGGPLGITLGLLGCGPQKDGATVTAKPSPPPPAATVDIDTTVPGGTPAYNSIPTPTAGR